MLAATILKAQMQSPRWLGLVRVRWKIHHIGKSTNNHWGFNHL